MEQSKTKIATASLELLGKGRNLADKLDEPITAVILGESLGEPTKGLIYYGADRIVSYGMGICDKDNIGMIEELGKLLKAEVGSTWLAVEAEWISHDFQIGQTGKTVKPELYVACGISGAVQHTVGMNRSKIVIAISNDPEADIFKFSRHRRRRYARLFLPLSTS